MSGVTGRMYGQRLLAVTQKLEQWEENSRGSLQGRTQYGSGTKRKWRMRRRVKVKVTVKLMVTGPGGLVYGVEAVCRSAREPKDGFKLNVVIPEKGTQVEWDC